MLVLVESFCCKEYSTAREGGAGMVQSHDYCLVFSTIIREQWDELKALTSAQGFERNQVIYSPGDAPDAIYLIESGRVKVAQLSDRGQEKITGIYQKGDLFGEICMCEKGARDDQAIALESSSVISFSVKHLLNLVKKTPELAVNLLMVFCARLAECSGQIATLAFDDVRVRVAKEFLRLSRLPESRPEKGGMQLPMNLTHQQLAELVNTTRENVTLIMNQFRRQGLLEYSRGKILVFPREIEKHLS